MNESVVDALRSEFHSISEEAAAFFEGAKTATEAKNAIEAWQRPSHRDWDYLTEDQRQTAQRIRAKITDFGLRLLEAARQSPLLEQTDEVEMRRLLRGMSASVLLRKYEFHDSYVISEEDRVFGVAPAEQSERSSEPAACAKNFRREAHQISEKMDFLAPRPENLTRAIVSKQLPSVQKYRPNTAFIMMQINNNIPGLEDVKFCIKEVFKEFGIEALRSDEIEHSDVITQRILDEIATSEFLIADLTGERPSVYYELGYAHAFGKRPILYRAERTPLHFDLLVHNVPEYKNVTDLKTKLRARLVAMTNRSPKT